MGPFFSNFSDVFLDQWQRIFCALHYNDFDKTLFIAVTTLASEALGSISEIPSRINWAALVITWCWYVLEIGTFSPVYRSQRFISSRVVST